LRLSVLFQINSPLRFRIKYSTIETKEAARIGYSEFYKHLSSRIVVTKVSYNNGSYTFLVIWTRVTHIIKLILSDLGYINSSNTVI
jgi:hypothetical protein